MVKVKAMHEVILAILLASAGYLAPISKPIREAAATEIPENIPNPRYST